METVEKVGSATVAASDKITCECCNADYHKLPGNKNDCPLCNAPGGKGPSFEVPQQVSTAVASAMETFHRLAQGLSQRVAELESRVTALEQKAGQ